MAEQSAYECPDMTNRDVNNINAHIKAAFEDTFGEPENIRSIDCIWRIGYKCFEGGRNCCYKFLTTICGLCIALYWGCCFACLAFEHIWYVTPCLNAFQIECLAWRRYYTVIMECCCAPCCEVIGLMFSRITVTNKSG